MVKRRFSAWTLFQGALFLIAWLSLLWLIVLVRWYDTEMPRSPDPLHGRTVPVVITGNTPMYLTSHESRMWQLAQYASGSGIIVLFAVLAIRANAKSG
jgi:hypothetical protein